MIQGFAVVPDGKKRPVAVFVQLEDAIDWAMARYGADAFRIQNWRAVAREGTAPAPAERGAPS